MTEENVNEPSWSGLHDLTYVYVVFSKVTDKVLKQVEANIIIKSLQEWVPDLEQERAHSIFTEALKRYQSEEDWHLSFLSSLQSVKDILSKEHILGIISDLVNIARSDGRIFDTEKQLIGEVACVLLGDLTEDVLYEMV